jgi:hypothetical protein
VIVGSGRARAGVNDRSDVLASQRRGEAAGNEPVHDLYARNVPRVRHDLEERAIERQCALQFGKFGGARLPEQLRLFPIGTIGISGVHAVHVLDDREAGGSQRVGEQKCAGVGPVERDARGRELMMVIRRKGAPYDRAGRREVNGELARDGGMVDIGDALRRKQARKDMAVLAGLACGERSKRPDRQAEVQTNTLVWGGAHPGPGQDEQTVLRQERPQLVHERKDRLMAAIHDGAAADLDDLQPREQPDRVSAGDGEGEIVVKKGLARER